MSGNELQRACQCLNICFTIVPEDVLSATELDLARSLFPPENVPKLLVVGRVTSVSTKHTVLSSRVEQQGWMVHACENCLMSVFVSDSSNRAAVDGACKRESEFASIRSSPNFSQTFGIAIPHKSSGEAAWHSIDVSGSPQELLTLAMEQISNEKLAVDQRIKAYAYQQREQFEAYRQRTLVELEALSAAVVKVLDEKPSSSSSSSSSSSFVRGSSPRTSPFHLTPPRASPTPPILSSAPRSGHSLDRRPSINSSYPSRDSVSLDSPAGVDLNGEATPGDDSIFEFEEDVGANSSSSGYYLSANTFNGWDQQEDEEDGEPRPATEATRIPPLGSRNEGFAIASSLPISIPQSFKFTPRGSTSMVRGMSGVGEFKVGSGAARSGLSTSAVNRQPTPTSRALDDEDESVVNMLLPPHSVVENMRGVRKGSEKDAEEQFEHAVRFQSLSLKTRTYL